MFSRQEKVIGKEAQQRLEQAHVVIVGVGALGSVAAELLTRAGVGKLTLIDRDVVETSNLSRQFYTHADVGKKKVDALAARLGTLASVKLQTHYTHLHQGNQNLLAADLILDGTDNLKTRFIINAYAKRHAIPFIAGGALGTTGFVFPVIEGACLECFHTQVQMPTCAQVGVLNTITTLVAAQQVALAVAQLTGEHVATDYLRMQSGAIKAIKVPKAAKCLGCLGQIEPEKTRMIQFCGKTAYLMPKTQKHINHPQITVFDDATVLIAARSLDVAEKLYAEFLGC